jgi:phage terminase large subunit
MYKLNPNLRDFWLTRKTYKLLKGGRFSSKTQDAGGIAVFLARNYSLRFLCTRQFQNKISESVYTVLIDKITQAGWKNEFDIGVSSIRHKTTGSEFLFYGIARNIDEIKGTENIDVCWIEEGEGLTKEQWAVIDPTIRKSGSEVWVLWNPRLASDFVERDLPALLGDACIIRHINYLENPFLSDTAKEKAERLKNVDPDEYRHIYLGEARTDDDSVIIKASWIQAAIDAHIKLNIEITGANRMGFDVADSGGDKNAAVSAKGILVTQCEEWAAGEDKIIDSCLRVYNMAKESDSTISYDSIGVGAFVGSKLNEIGWRKHRKFNAGGKVWRPEKQYQHNVKNKDFFLNAKAQAWWLVADRFRNTYNAVTTGAQYEQDDLISISSECANLQQLIRELSTPKRDFDAGGKVKVESKQELAKRGIKSPNLADAFIMAVYEVYEEEKPAKEIQFARQW